MIWFLAILVVLGAVTLFVMGPLRRGRAAEAQERQSTLVAELEAAKDAKYREIRDAEMDLRTGKLSEADHRALDRTLRAEAIEILRALDRAQGRERT